MDMEKVMLKMELDFYKNLAEELIKEKQKRIRDEKGVITFGSEMYTEAKSFIKEVTVDPTVRCHECICSTCFNTVCTGCEFEKERCDGCVDLTDVDDEEEFYN